MELNIHIANSFKDFPCSFKFAISNTIPLIETGKSKKEVKEAIINIYNSLKPLEVKQKNVFTLRIDIVDVLINKFRYNDCPLYHNKVYILFYENEKEIYKISLLDILNHEFSIFEKLDTIVILKSQYY
jgi:hypothetical protein